MTKLYGANSEKLEKGSQLSYGNGLGLKRCRVSPNFNPLPKEEKAGNPTFPKVVNDKGQFSLKRVYVNYSYLNDSQSARPAKRFDREKTQAEKETDTR